MHDQHGSAESCTGWCQVWRTRSKALRRRPLCDSVADGCCLSGDAPLPEQVLPLGVAASRRATCSSRAATWQERGRLQHFANNARLQQARYLDPQGCPLGLVKLVSPGPFDNLILGCKSQ